MPVHEDRNMGADLAVFVDYVRPDPGLHSKQLVERLLKIRSSDLVDEPRLDRVREQPRQPKRRGHGISWIAPIRGNEGSSCSHRPPLSVVSQSLPPVVPKQNIPSLSPSKAPRSTPVN